MTSNLTTWKRHEVGGTAVFMAGDGPALVLLHANGGDHHDYDAVADRLVAAGNRVISVDWPGHGDSAMSNSTTAVGFAELLPRLLEAIVAATGTSAPFVLVGNSVGGFAAVRTAITHAELVAGLILVNPGGFTPKWPSTWVACRLIGSRLVARRAMEWLPRMYLRVRNDTTRRMISDMNSHACDPARVRTFGAMWRSFTDPRHQAVARDEQVACPVLLMWGTRDPILPWFIDGRRARRELRNAEITHLRCGHQAFAESPDAFLQCVEPFLVSLSRNG